MRGILQTRCGCERSIYVPCPPPPKIEIPLYAQFRKPAHPESFVGHSRLFVLRDGGPIRPLPVADVVYYVEVAQS